MLRRAYTSIRAGIRDLGVAATACYFLDKLLEGCSRGRVRLFFYCLQVLPVPERELLPAHRGRQFEITEILAGNPVLDDQPRSPAVIKYRFDQGSRCLGAFYEQRLVGQLWLQFDSYLEDEVRSRFQLVQSKDVAWDYGVYVDPEYRGSAVFGRLWDAAFNLLRNAGMQWCASRVSAWNIASLRAHRRLGARNVGKALYCVVGPTQLVLSTLAPYVHLSASRKSQPVVRIEVPPRARSARPN